MNDDLKELYMGHLGLNRQQVRLIATATMKRYQNNSINACYGYIQTRDNILLYGMLYAILFPVDICFSSSSCVFNAIIIHAVNEVIKVRCL
jgi:hypothetical protein